MTTMLRQPTPIDEQSATGETARIYHDIRSGRMTVSSSTT